ncbi:MAG TPA: hypothetical protein VFE47_04115 [Tepidisphaeraceae bacterium]|jgi:Arc/MetJ-type ribon-helix-helix transcriptional regulator|nr:hypothetical protein [Tepidisphaeraceae bacterium]
MTITMTAKMERLVEEMLEAGAYGTPEEVLLAGLVSLSRYDAEDFGVPEHLRVTSSDQLNRLLEEGERSIREEGTLDGDEAFAERRERRGRARGEFP